MASSVPMVVGRRREAEVIDAFVAQIAHGARSLVLGGDPGIGKSTLWWSTVDACRSAGFRTLVARPAEEDLSVPLIGLADLFDGTDVDVAAIVDDDNPFARGRSVLDALRVVTADRPTILAIDDLHWLDPASARALRFALRRLDREPIGFLATIRSGHGSLAIEELAAAMLPGRSERLIVGPLGVEDLRRILMGIVPAISRPALRRIHAASGGNPLHAIELTRVLVGGGDATSGSLAATIERRLDGLPSEIGPVLEAAAGLGRPTADQLVEALPADGQALLEAAIANGILVLGNGDDVRFAHPLVQSVVYERMPPVRRRALHAHLATLTEDVDVRARHLARSVASPDAALATEVAAAAERASRRGAFDLAAEFAGHALRLAPPDDLAAVLAHGLAEIRALAAAGEWTRGLAVADALVARLPPGPARAEAIMERAYLEDDDYETGERWLEQALVDAGDDAALRVRVLDWLGWARGMHRGALLEGIAVEAEAVRIAETLGDRALLLPRARTLEHMRVAAGLGDPAGLQRILASEIELRPPPLDVGPHAAFAEALFWEGDLVGSRVVIDQVRDEAVAAQDEHARAYWLYDRAVLEIASGNLERASDDVREAIEAARDARDSWGEALLQHALALNLAWQGDVDGATAVASSRLSRAVQRNERPWIARLQHVLGLLALSRGEVAEARTLLGGADDLVDSMGFGHPAVFRLLPDAIEAAAAAGEVAEARARLARLEAQAVRTASRWVDAATARARGSVLTAEGDAPAALEPLCAAVASFDSLGFRPDAARARLELGRAYQAVGSRTRAADALAGAYDMFLAMGAPLWAGRAVVALERVAPGRADGELTEIEARIVARVAAGKRNREIGAELFMSVSSVEAHLTRVYRKLGVRSRAELGRLGVVTGSSGVEGHITPAST